MNELPEGVHVFDVRIEGRDRCLVALVEGEPTQVFERGLAGPEVLGELAEPPENEVDWALFRKNSAFSSFVEKYVNTLESWTSSLDEEARRNPGGWVYRLEPGSEQEDGSVAPEDVIGGYQIDLEGRAIPESFRYNPNHSLVPTQRRGFSALLFDEGLRRALFDECRRLLDTRGAGP